MGQMTVAIVYGCKLIDEIESNFEAPDYDPDFGDSPVFALDDQCRKWGIWLEMGDDLTCIGFSIASPCAQNEACLSGALTTEEIPSRYPAEYERAQRNYARLQEWIGQNYSGYQLPPASMLVVVVERA